MDQSLQWCEDHHLVPKGYGYIYLGERVMLEWLRSYSYEKLLPVYKRVVEQTTRRYGKRVPYVEVINEAHDKTNLFRRQPDQILELTREGCAAARRGRARGHPPDRNNCCLMGRVCQKPQQRRFAQMVAVALFERLRQVQG